MTGNWQDVLSDTSTQERYTTMFRARNEELGAFIESGLDDASGELFEAVGGNRQVGEGRSTRAEALPLDGLPVAVKDNIAVEGFHLTCGSRLLRQYRCPYDATAVRLLREAGAFIPGKTALDEFGMGSATDTSSFVDCRNPWDTGRTAGGSSGGSAAAVAAGMVPAALGSDTGGSIRQPAGFCGVYGLKPTYGAVSRYGLVAYASSLDTVGVLADTPQRIADVFAVIR
ncbi:MAG: amidase family protein, partial [Spirochaetota bacterium]